MKTTNHKTYDQFKGGGGVTRRNAGTNGRVERYCESCKQVEFEGFIDGKWRTRKLFTAPNGKISCQRCERIRIEDAERAQRQRERVQELTRQIEGHKDAIRDTTIRMKAITIANRSN